MATKWQEKNVGVISKFKPGAKKTTPVIDQRTGEVGGSQTEHYDGSVDAAVVPTPVGSKSRTMGKE